MSGDATGLGQGKTMGYNLPGAGGVGGSDAAKPAGTVVESVHRHQTICRELLKLVQEEQEALAGGGEFQAAGFHQRRRFLLPRLDETLREIRRHAAVWQELSGPQRSQQAGLGAMLRSAQDLIMRILVLDRENEQVLLRRGLLSPRHLPTAMHRQPHFVANLYRRGAPPTE